VRAIAAVALERRESRGGHLRADYPDQNPELGGIHLVVAADGTTRRERWD
jgi:aspartate oxidase